MAATNDPRRFRVRAMLAGVFLVAVLGSGAVYGVRLSRSVATLRFGLAAPAGPWVFVAGDSRAGDVRGWLVDRGDGRRLALGRLLDRRDQETLYQVISFSRDGRHAAWFSRRSAPFGKPYYRLDSANLTARVPAAVASVFDTPTVPSFAVSPSGTTVASVLEDQVTVIDLPDGQPRFMLPLPPFARRRKHLLFYLDDTHVRLIPGQKFEPRPQILELDLNSRTIAAVGAVESDYPGLFLRSSHDGSRMLALERQRTKNSIRDGRTGQLLALLPPVGKLGNAYFLADSGVATMSGSAEFNVSGVATRIAGPRALLALFGADGAERLRLALPEGGVVEGQPTAETLLLALRAPAQGSSQHEHWVVQHVDMRTGRVLRSLRGLAPLSTMSFWYLPTLRPPRLGDRDYPCFDAEGNLVSVDIFTGVTTLVFTPGHLR
ncbi:MAG TPA: hypothetical protein VMT00_03160 [Thermoanaerobaculia bacterium]|nr:hypothetical protein [Thermoanaerobaculia bacterium]